jgi:lysyl-tRNA synthetase class I
LNEKSLKKVLDEIFSIKRDSKHCKNKKEKISGYDHAGYLKWQCECGHESEWENLEDSFTKIGNKI